MSDEQEGAKKRAMADMVNLELTRDEFGLLVVHVETQLGEYQQALAKMEEGEGESVPSWNMKRNLQKHVDVLEDLAMKMQGVAKDAGWR